MSAKSSEDSGEINDEYEATANEEAPSTESSSFGNVLPMENLKHGWKVIGTFVSQTATQINDSEAVKSMKNKATEINESESVKKFKARAAEVSAPLIEQAGHTWETTKEKAGPVAKDLWDRTKEFSSSAVETAKPAVEKIGETAVFVGQKISEVSGKVMEEIHKLIDLDDHDEEVAPPNEYFNNANATSGASSSSTAGSAAAVPMETDPDESPFSI